MIVGVVSQARELGSIGTSVEMQEGLNIWKLVKEMEARRGRAHNDPRPRTSEKKASCGSLFDRRSWPYRLEYRLAIAESIERGGPFY